MLPERSMAQRMRDDEDHRLALCGLTDDPRLDWELEDREYQYHDFRFFTPAMFGATGERRRVACQKYECPAPPFFASGRRDPAPHDAKRASQLGGTPQPPASGWLAHPPLSKT